ncbi:FG-GAP repeat protein [Enhygromyxa salina]|uniref:FG-GAP repeat protein n=1 Tax=Enhygromyxa salina TaxID=215803 RepID=UPI0015E5F2C3|nr:FG-GAP repeat protein [Enhygromyxa salina]
MVLILALLTSRSARAMDPVSGPAVSECSYPSAVRIDSHCTGSYIGDGVVLMAGHCMDSENPKRVIFANADPDADPKGDRFEVDIAPDPDVISQEHCYSHPGGGAKSVANNIWHYAGVDLGVCVLDSSDPDYAKLDDLPTVPVMVPTGCIRDWLHELLWTTYDCAPGQVKGPSGCWTPPPPIGKPADGNFPGVDVVAIGMGKKPGGEDGFKRAFNPTLYVQVDNSGAKGPYANYYHQGSPTQLVTNHTVAWDETPIPGEGTLDGDSGGPILHRLPDGTWRVIGDLNGDASGGTPNALDLYEAAPAYVHWIEYVTGRDVTPCHDLNEEDEWVWHGDCLGDLPTSINEPGGGSFAANSCSLHDRGGKACGGWPAPPLDISAGTLPQPQHLWIEAKSVEAKLTPTLALAAQGQFGDPVSVDAVADYLYDASYADSSYTFLSSIFDAGQLGGYLSDAVSADFSGTGQLYEVYSDPDFDCGKGRLIVLDPNGVRTDWDLDTPGVLGAAACEDYFGAALTVGDFNGDGFEDLAASTPGARVNSEPGAGRIHVFYGSSSGLMASGDQVFDQESVGIGGVAAAWSFFGEQLTVGDFNCDGLDDLAIGTPRATVGGAHEAGSVHVMYGTSGGLGTLAAQDFADYGAAGVVVEANDHFGASIAAGRLTSATCSDLVIGTPDKDLGLEPDVGQVSIFYGGSAGLPDYPNTRVIQGQGGIADIGEAHDRFGARLEVIPGVDADTLRILVPNEDCDPSAPQQVVGWHSIVGSTGTIDPSANMLECVSVGEGQLSTAAWGDLEQLARLHAVRISRELNP